MPAQKPGKSKQDYATPIEFLVAVKKLLGLVTQGFSIDLAADRGNRVCEEYFDEALDALSPDSPGVRGHEDWSFYTGATGWGWLNPPYANIGPWAKKCVEQSDRAHIAFLVPAGVGANWFRDYVHGKARVLLLNGRLTFGGCAQPYPKDCIICLYGPDVKVGYDVWSWRTGELNGAQPTQLGTEMPSVVGYSLESY